MSESSFRVSDRRLFNPDGSLRSPATQTPEPEPVPKPAEPAPAGPPEPAPTGAETFEFTGEKVSFSEFMMSLAGNAMMCLGMADPAYGPMEPDLPSANHLIGALEMLKVKTRNNLTPDESRELDEVLNGLRGQYAALSRRYK